MSGTNEPDLTREPEFDPDFDPAEALEDAREAREAAEDEEFDTTIKAIVSSGLIAGPDASVIEEIVSEKDEDTDTADDAVATNAFGIPSNNPFGLPTMGDRTVDPTQAAADQLDLDLQVDAIYQSILKRAPEHKIQPSLERVRLADATPMAYEASALPVSVVPDPEGVKDSLYNYLLEHNSVPVRALQHIRATNANSRQAELLDIPLGQALLFITRVGYLEDGRAVEISHTWCRSDYYDFVAELRR